MGFHEFSSPYDWSRIASYKRTAKAAFGGMIDLSVGSPVDPVPDSVRKALAISSNDPNAYGYPVTAGTADLRDAIHGAVRGRPQCRFACDRRRCGADGRFQGRRRVDGVAAAFRRGRCRRAAAGVVSDVRDRHAVGRRANAEGRRRGGCGFLERMRRCVKAVWVNSPCNPTGEVLSAEQMAGIVRAARALRCRGAVRRMLCVDAMGRDHVAEADADTLASTPCALRADVCGGSAEGVLVLYSLSKQSNMAGYRTALIAGEQSLIGPMAAYRKQIGQIIPGPVQAAMAAGLRDFDAVKTQHSRYQERLGMLVSALRAYGYCTDMPQGALYGLGESQVRRLLGRDLRQLAEIGIVASPGEFYGAPEYLRFSATASDAAIASAAERLAR